MATTRVEFLEIGDKVMPPAREVRLWMRRALRERNLPESALHLTVTKIHEGNSDKRGRWLVITCDQTPEWLGDAKPYPFIFKARPESPWVKV